MLKIKFLAIQIHAAIKANNDIKTKEYQLNQIVSNETYIYSLFQESNITNYNLTLSTFLLTSPVLIYIGSLWYSLH